MSQSTRLDIVNPCKVLRIAQKTAYRQMTREYYQKTKETLAANRAGRMFNRQAVKFLTDPSDYGPKLAKVSHQLIPSLEHRTIPEWQISDQLLQIIIKVDFEDLMLHVEVQRSQFQSLLRHIHDAELEVECLVQRFAVREPDLFDYKRRKIAQPEIRLKLRQHFYRKDDDITTLIAQNPRFNILQHCNCKDLDDGDNMEYMHDFLQRCIKQVAGRLNDNGSSFDRIVDHMLEICQYFF